MNREDKLPDQLRQKAAHIDDNAATWPTQTRDYVHSEADFLRDAASYIEELEARGAITGEARCNECHRPASTCDCGMDSEGRFDAPASTGVREDEAARGCKCGCAESDHDYKTGKCNACFCESYEPASEVREDEARVRLRQAASNHSDDPAMPSQQVADDVNRVLDRLQAYEKALGRLIEAAAPYIDNAAPHEQLFNAEDTRNFDRLSSAMASARAALEGEDDG